MKIQIRAVSQISPDQSVICIVGKDEIPSHIVLNRSEKEYALRRLSENDEYVFVNSYYKCTYFVKANTELPHFMMLEEIRKRASSMKQLIRANNHTEIVITSEGLSEDVSEAFAEGFILSIYSFRKYKTKEEEKEKGRYPQKNIAS